MDLVWHSHVSFSMVTIIYFGQGIHHVPPSVSFIPRLSTSAAAKLSLIRSTIFFVAIICSQNKIMWPKRFSLEASLVWLLTAKPHCRPQAHFTTVDSSAHHNVSSREASLFANLCRCKHKQSYPNSICTRWNVECRLLCRAVHFALQKSGNNTKNRDYSECVYFVSLFS